MMSAGCSTTQRTLPSRRVSAQIVQSSPSARLKHCLQKPIFSLTSTIAAARGRISSGLSLSM